MSTLTASRSSALPMPTLFRHVLFGPLLLLAQWLVLGRLTLWGAYPDVVLLYVAWIGLHYGRRQASFAGFVLGFCMDAIYGTWGMHMLVKTIVGFLVGLFPASERETILIQPQQALVGGFVVALLHNGLFVALVALGSGARSAELVTALWIGSAVYTALVGTVAALFAVR